MVAMAFLVVNRVMLRGCKSVAKWLVLLYDYSTPGGCYAKPAG